MKKPFAFFILMLMLVSGCSGEKSPEDMGKQLPEQVTYNAEKGVLSISVPRDMPKGYMPYFYVSGRVKIGNEIVDWNAFQEQSDAVNWEFGKTFTAELAADSIDKVIVETGMLYDNSANLEYKYYVIIGEGGTIDISDNEPVEGVTVGDYRPMVFVNGALYGDTGEYAIALTDNWKHIGDIENVISQQEPMIKEEFTSNMLDIGDEIYSSDSDPSKIYVKISTSNFLIYEVLEE